MGWKDFLDKPSKQTIKETHYSGKKKIDVSDATRLKLSLSKKEQWEDPQNKSKGYEVIKVKFSKRILVNSGKPKKSEGDPVELICYNRSIPLQLNNSIFFLNISKEG